LLRYLLIAIAAELSLALTPAVAVAQSSAPITALPDCQGAPHARPANVIFACGDGGVYASNLRWTNWGEQFATGVGTLSKNDCEPNCAQGHFHTSPVAVVVADGISRSGVRSLGFRNSQRRRHDELVYL
jgi:hypothetical protein